MNTNQLIHEHRGLCWHEGGLAYRCRKCGAGLYDDDWSNPNYEEDMNACMELVNGHLWDLCNHQGGSFSAWIDGKCATAEAPQQAITKAYITLHNLETQ